MGAQTTPASLLDLIAGGSMQRANEMRQTEANTAQTLAQTQNVPIQGQLMQAQIPGVQANTRAQQIANQQAQQSIIDQQLYRQALAMAGQPQSQSGPPASPITTPPFVQQPVPVTNTPGVSSQLMRRPDPTAPPQTNVQPPAPSQAQPNVPLPFEDPVAFAQHLASVRGPNGEQISGGFLQSSLANNIATQKSILAMSAEKRAAELAALGPVQDIIQGWQEVPDGPQRQAVIARDLPRLQQLDPHFASIVQQAGSTDDNTLNMLDANAGVLKQHLENIGTKAKAAEETANAGKTIAETPGAIAKSEQDRLVTDAMKNAMEHPEAIEKSIRDALPLDPTAADSYISQAHALQRAGVKPEEVAKVVGNAVAHNSAISQTINPNMIRGKAQTAAATEAATNPYREAAARDLAQFGHGLSQESKATELAQGALEDYHTSNSAIDGVKSLIANAVQSKNSVSASQVPGLAAAASLALFNIKRLPASAAGGMGNLNEKATGILQSMIGGSPVSATELGELDSFLDVIKSSTAAKYNGTKDSIEQTYKGVKLPDINQVSPKTAGQYKAGDTRVINGRTVTRDADGNWK